MNEKKHGGSDVFVLFWQNDGKIPTVFVFEPTAEKLFNFTFSNGCTRDNLIGLFKYFSTPRGGQFQMPFAVVNLVYMFAKGSALPH